MHVYHSQTATVDPSSPSTHPWPAYPCCDLVWSRLLYPFSNLLSPPNVQHGTGQHSARSGIGSGSARRIGKACRDGMICVGSPKENGVSSVDSGTAHKIQRGDSHTEKYCSRENLPRLLLVGQRRQPLSPFCLPPIRIRLMTTTRTYRYYVLPRKALAWFILLLNLSSNLISTRQDNTRQYKTDKTRQDLRRETTWTTWIKSSNWNMLIQTILQVEY